MRTLRTRSSVIDIELKGSKCTMSLNPRGKEDKMPNQRNHHRSNTDCEIDSFTHIACTTLSTPHARATRLPMYTCRHASS